VKRFLGFGHYSVDEAARAEACGPRVRPRKIQVDVEIRREGKEMKINSHEADGVTVLDLTGPLVLGDGTVALRDQIRALLGKGQKRILLNLRGVPYIDSCGVGELVTSYTSVRNQGGDLKLVHLEKRVHGVLQITKLHTIFEVYEDQTAAVRSFAKGQTRAT
jgi:anti-sigma B factor antagonist